mmetsp:Transcript_23647/g.63150  ORF Transcript_23647/g.63150 Transcript_23647/m.63150 type:complete len:280 (+) Transcript_23647:348-1187(+)
MLGFRKILTTVRPYLPVGLQGTHATVLLIHTNVTGTTRDLPPHRHLARVATTELDLAVVLGSTQAQVWVWRPPDHTIAIGEDELRHYGPAIANAGVERLPHDRPPRAETKLVAILQPMQLAPGEVHDASPHTVASHISISLRALPKEGVDPIARTILVVLVNAQGRVVLQANRTISGRHRPLHCAGALVAHVQYDMCPHLQVAAVDVQAKLRVCSPMDHAVHSGENELLVGVAFATLPQLDPCSRCCLPKFDIKALVGMPSPVKHPRSAQSHRVVRNHR